jgi:crotonobetainyl-CoA:carnitine CoA-transferase CaiB-like acyl-CoA transferase
MNYRATPERGQHTNEILAEFGYSPSEIENLAQRGII